jgi:hypothetical protein
MQMRVAALLLLLVISVSALHAQNRPPSTTATEEVVDSAGDSGGTTTATGVTQVAGTTTSTTTTTRSITTRTSTPRWIHLVRIAATAGPIAFLLLAWLLGWIVHWRLVRSEQEQFPFHRGSRSPQTVPVILSAALLFVPAVLFLIFEVRSRLEIRRGIGGVVDEWHPVTARAWITLLICFVLALVPWLFAKRADTVAQEG